VLLDGFLALAAPFAATVLRTIWARATERLCDARAACVTGRPDLVAQAMVHLCRMRSTPSLEDATSFPPRGAELADRVRAVLAGGPDGSQAGRRLSVAAAVLVAHVTVAAIVLAEQLHHALETLLG
jgi:hypothetical protein